MYFQDPRTLLQIYAQLEEQNLFLIQNAQESEEALEELRAKFRCVRTHTHSGHACSGNVPTASVLLLRKGTSLCVHGCYVMPRACEQQSAAGAERGQWSSWCSRDRGT